MRIDLITLLIIVIYLIIIFKDDLIPLLGIEKINEPFFDERSELIDAIANKLQISSRRIVNLIYGFYPEGSKNLGVRFGILPKNNFEINEPDNDEMLEIINYLFETNTFTINYNNELILLNNNSLVVDESDKKDNFQNIAGDKL